MPRINPTDPRLNNPEIQAIIQKTQPDPFGSKDPGYESKKKRFDDYYTILEIFRPEISQPFYEQEKMQNDLDHSKNIPWTDSLSDLIDKTSLAIKEQFEWIVINILCAFNPDTEKGSGPPSYSPYGHPLTDLKSGFATGGLGRCKNILGIVCKHLAEQGALTLQNFRDHIWAGMNFADNLAALNSGDDGTAISGTLDDPFRNFSVSKAKVDFKGIYKERFKELKAKFNPTKDGCPARKFLIKLNLDSHPQGKIINLVKAYYWLIAKNVEAELFKKTA